MRLYELFNDGSTPPGVNYVLNVPSKPGSGTPATANAVPSSNTANVASSNAQAPEGNTTETPGNQPVNATTMQKLSQGNTLSFPVGPSKTKTQLKVSKVGNDKDKTVTLTNPQHPEEPGQTYKAADLAQVLADQEKVQQ